MYLMVYAFQFVKGMEVRRIGYETTVGIELYDTRRTLRGNLSDNTAKAVVTNIFYKQIGYEQVGMREGGV